MRQEITAIRKFQHSIKNQKGVALMLAIACIMLIMHFAMEISYDSNVEYIVNSQELNRIKAYYAAKSGMQLSLLRIKIYQQAQNKVGKQLGNSPILEKLWQFPFSWPLPIPAEMSEIDKDSFKKISKDSSMDSSYIATIEDEGSKLDLNDLNSPSKYLRDTTRKQLVNMFEQKRKDDEEFARLYSNTNFEELINSIADWTSSKSESLNGGDKRSAYSDLNSESQNDYYPPNRNFRTLAELHFVPGMTDDFYKLLEPRVTIFGMKGINPNLASREVLKSLDPGMTDEAVSAIVKRRDSELGFFQCDQDGGSSEFWSFVTAQNVRLLGDPQSIPLTCDTVMNFKIKSIGNFAKSTKEITAIVVNIDRAASKIKTFVDKEKQQMMDPQRSQQQQKQQQTAPTLLPKGPPRIVYWTER